MFSLSVKLSELYDIHLIPVIFVNDYSLAVWLVED